MGKKQNRHCYYITVSFLYGFGKHLRLSADMHKLLVFIQYIKKVRNYLLT